MESTRILAAPESKGPAEIALPIPLSDSHIKTSSPMVLASKPLYLNHPQFEGFEVRQMVGGGKVHKPCLSNTERRGRRLAGNA
jgi:hypothetical protein